ncbi:MAG: hypothetical protein ACK4GU_16150 [Alishewanella aestuarii]
MTFSSNGSVNQLVQAQQAFFGSGLSAEKIPSQQVKALRLRADRIVKACKRLRKLKPESGSSCYSNQDAVLTELCLDFGIKDINDLLLSDCKSALWNLELKHFRLLHEIAEYEKIQANRQTVSAAAEQRERSIKAGRLVRVASKDETAEVWNIQKKHRYVKTLWRIFTTPWYIGVAFAVFLILIFWFITFVAAKQNSQSLLVISGFGIALWFAAAVIFVQRANKDIYNSNPYRWAKCDHRLNQIRGAKFIADFKAQLPNYLSVALFVRDELDRALRYRPRPFSFWLFSICLAVFFVAFAIWMGAGVMNMRFGEASVIWGMTSVAFLATATFALSDYLVQLRERELLLWLEWLIVDEQREPIISSPE